MVAVGVTPVGTTGLKSCDPRPGATSWLLTLECLAKRRRALLGGQPGRGIARRTHRNDTCGSALFRGCPTRLRSDRFSRLGRLPPTGRNRRVAATAGSCWAWAPKENIVKQESNPVPMASNPPESPENFHQSKRNSRVGGSVQSKNIVVCCDGTGNEYGSNNTNVVKLFELLERDHHQQVAYYDPGVGTFSVLGWQLPIGRKFGHPPRKSLRSWSAAERRRCIQVLDVHVPSR